MKSWRTGIFLQITERVLVTLVVVFQGCFVAGKITGKSTNQNKTAIKTA